MKHMETMYKETMYKRDYHLRKAKSTGSELDWSRYKQIRNRVTTLIRASKNNYQRNLFHSNSKSPRDFWKQIKKVYPTKQKSSVNHVFDIKDKKTSDKHVIANAFCSFFSTVAKKLYNCHYKLTNCTWKTFNSPVNLKAQVNPHNYKFKFHKVKICEVNRILSLLKTSKSAGNDNLPAKMIKDASDVISKPLCNLINQSLESSLFPTAEKIAKVSPCYKSDSHASLDNYRPISVLNILSKVIERIVYNQLTTYLEDHELISQSQYGFRRNRSTQHAVTLLTEYIRTNGNNSALTGALYIDLKKAFDTVNHACLIDKLSLYGVENNELDWFCDYLFNRSQYVVYDSVKSESSKITHGVPQGSILGPLLFIILVNDIEPILRHCNLLMYADDTVLYCASKNINAIENMLNEDANLIAKWFDENNLIFNLKKGKTESVIYGTTQKLSRNRESVLININDQPVNQTNSYEYLGVTLDNKLLLREYVDNIYKRMSNRVKQLSQIRNQISPSTANSIYKMMILPIMFYCNPVCASLPRSVNERFDKLHDRAKNIIHGNCVTNQWDDITTLRKRKISIDVFKSLNSITPPAFRQFYNKLSHSMSTRGNNSKLLLPKVRTEFGRKAMSFQGALVFNELPPTIRNEQYFANFKRKITAHCF